MVPKELTSLSHKPGGRRREELAYLPWTVVQLLPEITIRPATTRTMGKLPTYLNATLKKGQTTHLIDGTTLKLKKKRTQEMKRLEK